MRKNKGNIIKYLEYEVEYYIVKKEMKEDIREIRNLEKEDLMKKYSREV